MLSFFMLILWKTISQFKLLDREPIAFFIQSIFIMLFRFNWLNYVNQSINGQEFILLNFLFKI